MSNWLSVSSCPCKYVSLTRSNNQSHFVIISPLAHGNGIYKYNIHQDQWTKLMEYNKQFVLSNLSCVSTAFDETNNLIYVCNDQSQLLVFNLINTSMNLLIKNSVIRPFVPMICVNGIVHLIGVDSISNKHYIYHKNSNSLHEIYRFDISKSDDFISNFVYLKSKETIILFNRVTSELHEFQTWDNKRLKYKCKSIPFVRGTAIVATKSEQYLIGFGGSKGYGVSSRCNDIFIFDVKKKEFTKANIKCPIAGFYEAIIMRNDNKDELLVFGYVNQCYGCNAFVNLQKLPTYIIKLINGWVCNEWIYLIEYATGKHWKINVDYIFQSLK